MGNAKVELSVDKDIYVKKTIKIKMNRITESESLYNDLDRMTTSELLLSINQEDQKVALLVQSKLPQIEKLVDAVYQQMKDGGRLFYIGAGTSGRLGIVDASECPPTFGVPHDWVVGIISGGDRAIRKAVEFAEDDSMQAWNDLADYGLNTQDIVVGIAASGTTPYVLGGLQKCNEEGIPTGCIVCNEESPIELQSKFPVAVPVGPEFVTGSTRMKSGTAQKLVLNMLTTAVMVKLGRVVGNRMVDMQLSNNKLVDRGTNLVVERTGLAYEEAKKLLLDKGSIRAALEALK